MKFWKLYLLTIYNMAVMLLLLLPEYVALPPQAEWLLYLFTLFSLIPAVVFTVYAAAQQLAAQGVKREQQVVFGVYIISSALLYLIATDKYESINTVLTRLLG